MHIARTCTLCISSVHECIHVCDGTRRGCKVLMMTRASDKHWQKSFPLSWSAENLLVPSFLSQLRITVFIVSTYICNYTCNYSYTCYCTLLNRFGAVSMRPALKEPMYKCSLVAFTRYGAELEEVQKCYEQHKVE